jgi:hypothetical protein
MEESPSSVLLEVCVAEIEQLPLICPDSLTRLTRIASDFLHGHLPYPEAHAAFFFTIGCTWPIERIRTILEVPEEPLPPCLDDSAGLCKRLWSSYEDSRLLAGIYRYGVKNWAPIAHFVGNSRSRSQCAQRWTRGLNPRLRKASWDPGEDARLVQLVGSYGEKAWTKISASMGNRSDVQCRYHYAQLMKQSPQPRAASLGAFPTLADRPRPTTGIAVRPAFMAVPPPRFSMPNCKDLPIELGQRRRLSNLSVAPIGLPELEQVPETKQKAAEEEKEDAGRFLSVESLLNPLH